MRAASVAVKITVHSSIRDLDQQAWDALVGDGSPFLEWGWLASLEEARCVGERTGWVPQHLTLHDGARLLGA